MSNQILLKHFHSCKTKIIRLRKSGRKDKTIIAFILTESFFRNRAHRFLEYLAWLATGIFWPARIKYLSIGLCQVQIRYWVELGFIKSTKPTLDSLLSVCNLKKNYDITQQFLAGNAEQDLIKLAYYYNGKPTPAYLTVLQTFNRWLDKQIY